MGLQKTKKKIRDQWKIGLWRKEAKEKSLGRYPTVEVHLFGKLEVRGESLFIIRVVWTYS